MIKNQFIKSKIVILSITGNIATDQRVHKVAMSLIKIGMKPFLVGRKSATSNLNQNRDYKTKQLTLIFSKGPLFYAEFNIRLFFFLLFSKVDVLLSNDLDTLLANYLVYRIKHLINKKIKLVYDSHEIYTEVPELNNRILVKEIWLWIEKMILPKLKNTYTVCEPIKAYYKSKYGINMSVIKNMPIGSVQGSKPIELPFLIPENKKIILYQGALNVGRGIEHVIPLMEHISNAVFVIIGSGDLEQELKEMVFEMSLSHRVIFTGNLNLEQLNQYTPKAHIGLVLQEDISLSYHYVLPNRLFDFIKAEVPVLASDLVEIQQIVGKENIGLLVNGFEPEILLKNIQIMLENEDLIKKFKASLKKCKSKYCWENQENVLFDLFRNLNA